MQLELSLPFGPSPWHRSCHCVATSSKRTWLSRKWSLWDTSLYQVLTTLQLSEVGPGYPTP